MMKMEQKNPIKELAKQLRCPSGKEGREIANNMFTTNRYMIGETTSKLQLQNNSQTLEVGFGNGKHIAPLLVKYPSLKYFGVDISSEMINLAAANNLNGRSQNRVFFQQVDESGTLPFPDQYFDRIFSVNTVYFWLDMQHTLNEWYRALKPHGQIVITFMEKEFAKTIPFTNYGFTLYHQNEIIQLLNQAQFSDIITSIHHDSMYKKDGTPIERTFLCISAIKKG